MFITSSIAATYLFRDLVFFLSIQGSQICCDNALSYHKKANLVTSELIARKRQSVPKNLSMHGLCLCRPVHTWGKAQTHTCVHRQACYRWLIGTAGLVTACVRGDIFLFTPCGESVWDEGERWGKRESEEGGEGARESVGHGGLGYTPILIFRIKSR